MYNYKIVDRMFMRPTIVSTSKQVKKQIDKFVAEYVKSVDVNNEEPRMFWVDGNEYDSENDFFVELQRFLQTKCKTVIIIGDKFDGEIMVNGGIV